MLNNASAANAARARTGIMVLSLVLSCRSVGAQAGITASDARSYAAGRRREIEFTDAALTMLACATTADQRTVIAAGASPDRAEIAVAADLSMRVADYRVLVARVDSVLRASRELNARTRGLDSLRVRLTVLRTRMNARESIQPSSTKNPQSRSVKCTAK